MFEVHVTFLLNGKKSKQGQMDEAVYASAGRHSDAVTNPAVNMREHIWRVKTFQSALELKNTLSQLSGVNVSVRET